MSRNTDGSGHNRDAKVDKNLRLWVHALTVTEDTEANKKGRAFNINTGKITLTDAVETPIIYLKNVNSNQSLHITAIAIGFGYNTGGDQTSMAEVTIVRNPTGGDIITEEKAVAIKSNRNFGSPETLTTANFDIFKGATGDTLTGGSDHLYVFANDQNRGYFSIDEVITKGTSIGVKILPLASNTSMPLYCAFLCHLEDSKG